MIEHEKAVIERAKEGDKQAFAELYDRYIQKIYRFVLVKTAHREEAEDLTHEVFFSAWRNLPHYVDQGFPFSSWLYQVARNKIIDHYRAKKITASVEDMTEIGDEPSEDAGIPQSIDQTFEIEKVKKLFSYLSHDEQDVILLRFLEDKTYDDIAKAMGKSEGAVRLIQHRAMLELKKRAMQEG